MSCELSILQFSSFAKGRKPYTGGITFEDVAFFASLDAVGETAYAIVDRTTFVDRYQLGPPLVVRVTTSQLAAGGHGTIVFVAPSSFKELNIIS